MRRRVLTLSHRDYVGGILAPLEYARPLLKDIGSSFQ